MSGKIYRNPSRNMQETVDRTPQYQLLGIEPEEYNGSRLYEPGMVAAPSAVNPRDKRSAIRRDAVEPASTGEPAIAGESAMNAAFIPNVGNNLDQTWSSVDGETIGDMSGVDPEGQMNESTPDNFRPPLSIDVEDDVFEEEYVDKVKSPRKKRAKKKTQSSSNEEEYMLIYNNSVICSGSFSKVEEQTRMLFFGESEITDYKPIPLDDIIVLKRLKIKVGLFLE